MRNHCLMTKKSKCSFGISKVEYLGHFISANGISTDLRKVEEVKNWPIPSNVKELKSFLGLEGYYRKFVRNYSIIAKPLTQLLKKGEFVWNEEATSALNHLKEALTTALILGFPDFNKPFVVETDPSAYGIGAVLMQEGRPLAFLSKTLGPRWQKLFLYEKELLAVVHAV